MRVSAIRHELQLIVCFETSVHHTATHIRKQQTATVRQIV